MAETSEREQLPALAALSTVFESFGRGVVCLDLELRILYVSPALRLRLGDGAAPSFDACPAAALFGDETFAPGAGLRSALERGEPWENAVVALRAGGAFLPARIAAAPVPAGVLAAGRESVAFVVIVEPAGALVSGNAPVVAPPAALDAPHLTIRSAERESERQFLSAVLAQHQWRRERAARALGISRTTLWRRMREAGLI